MKRASPTSITQFAWTSVFWNRSVPGQASHGAPHLLEDDEGVGLVDFPVFARVPEEGRGDSDVTWFCGDRERVPRRAVVVVEPRRAARRVPCR
jgi:hypothetical protein